MLALVFQVAGFVVGGVGLPHFPEDFNPALAEATQGAGVALAACAVGLVIRLGPRALEPGAVRPQVEGRAQERLAGAAHQVLFDLAGLERHRGGARVSLQAFGALKARPPVADLGQQARGELDAAARQRAKQAGVGMPGEEFLDAGAVGVELGLEGMQHPGQRDGQQAFGGDGAGRAAQVRGGGEDRQAFFHGGLFPELVLAEELLPLLRAGLGQGDGRGEGLHEGPAARACPGVEGGQCRRVVGAEGGAQLVDQGGAPADQGDLVAGEQAQLGNQGIVGHEGAPAVAVHAEGVGQAPGVALVVFGSGGGLALTVAHGALGVDRINRVTGVEQLFDGQTLVSLDGDGQRGAERGEGFAQVLPAFGRVLEAQLQDERAFDVDHGDVVVVARPVERTEVFALLPGRGGRSGRGDVRCFGVHGGFGVRPATGGPRADTTTLVGYGSLRGWAGRRTRSRCSWEGPRRASGTRPCLRVGEGGVGGRCSSSCGGLNPRKVQARPSLHFSIPSGSGLNHTANGISGTSRARPAPSLRPVTSPETVRKLMAVDSRLRLREAFNSISRA